VGSGLARRQPDDLQLDVDLEKRQAVDGVSHLADRSSDLEERAPTASEEPKKDAKDKKDKKDKKKTSAATATPTA
jgi:hypothetical protein